MAEYKKICLFYEGRMTTFRRVGWFRLTVSKAANERVLAHAKPSTRASPNSSARGLHDGRMGRGWHSIFRCEMTNQND